MLNLTRRVNETFKGEVTKRIAANEIRIEIRKEEVQLIQKAIIAKEQRIIPVDLNHFATGKQHRGKR